MRNLYLKFLYVSVTKNNFSQCSKCVRGFLSPFKGDSLLKIEQGQATLGYLSTYYSNLSQKLFQCCFIVTLVLAQQQVTAADQGLNSELKNKTFKLKDIFVYFQKIILDEFLKCVTQRCYSIWWQEKNSRELTVFPQRLCEPLGGTGFYL